MGKLSCRNKRKSEMRVICGKSSSNYAEPSKDQDLRLISDFEFCEADGVCGEVVISYQVTVLRQTDEVFLT